jgi:hypothetical protein
MMIDANAPIPSGFLSTSSGRWKSRKVAELRPALTSKVASTGVCGTSEGMTMLAQPNSVTAKKADATSLKRRSTRSNTRSSVLSTAQAPSRAKTPLVCAS